MVNHANTPCGNRRGSSVSPVGWRALASSGSTMSNSTALLACVIGSHEGGSLAPAACIGVRVPRTTRARCRRSAPVCPGTPVALAAAGPAAGAAQAAPKARRHAPIGTPSPWPAKCRGICECFSQARLATLGGNQAGCTSRLEAALQTRNLTFGEPEPLSRTHAGETSFDHRFDNFDALQFVHADRDQAGLVHGRIHRVAPRQHAPAAGLNRTFLTGSNRHY